MLLPMQDLPEAPAELVLELASRYIELYQRITGERFKPAQPGRRLDSSNWLT